MQKELCGLDTHERVFAIFARETTSVTFIAFQQTKSLLKGVHSKRKESLGSKFFPFRVDPFSEGREQILSF